VAHALAKVPASYYTDLAAAYERKRDLLAGTCRRLGWRPIVPAGAYYLMVEPRGLGGESAREAADRVLREARVASIPGSAFHADGGGEHLLRFCFAKTDEDLALACRRLTAAFDGAGRVGAGGGGGMS
jgi:aminotransferase